MEPMMPPAGRPGALLPRHPRRPEAGRPDRARPQLQLRRPQAGVLGLSHRHPRRGDLGRRAGPGRRARRIYIVEPTGPIEDDPNLTDKKFPGNPTLSYRSREPLGSPARSREWQGHPPEQLKAMKDHLERLKAQGIEAID